MLALEHIGISEFMFKPEYISNTQKFLDKKREFLLAFIGSELKESWAVWDLEDDEWFKDGPILLIFENSKMVFCTNKLEELSVTNEDINLTSKPNVSWAEFDLAWRKNPIKEINNLLGKDLKKMYVTESEFTGSVEESKNNPELVGTRVSEWYLSGLDMEFSGGCISLFNALDENGVSDCADNDKGTRRIEVVS
ncbi:hypothetical protein ACFL2V_20595 [Pseudomonadota bacterium]